MPIYAPALSEIVAGCWNSCGGIKITRTHHDVFLYVHRRCCKYKANMVWIFYTLLFLGVIFILKVNYVFAPTYCNMA
jgi:hypothetical protein